MADQLERYRRKKSNCRRRGILFTLTLKQFREIEERYGPRGGSGWLMVQSVPDDGYVPGNVEMMSAAEHLRRNMDAHYGGERSYIP
jgi:hypothetical protein